MDYYTTLATVLPLLYVAIVLEKRLGSVPRVSDLPEAAEDPESARMLDRFLQWDWMMARLLIFVGIPLTEVGLLVGIERGHRISGVDDAVQVVGIAAMLVLICPPIWDQIAPLVPEKHRVIAVVYLFNAVFLAFFALVVLDLAGWFGTSSVRPH